MGETLFLGRSMEGLFGFYLFTTIQYFEKLFLSFLQWNLRKWQDNLTILQNLRKHVKTGILNTLGKDSWKQHLILQTGLFQSCIYPGTSRWPANQQGLKRDTVKLKITPLFEIWSLVLICLPARQMIGEKEVFYHFLKFCILRFWLVIFYV